MSQGHPSSVWNPSYAEAFRGGLQALQLKGLEEAEIIELVAPLDKKLESPVDQYLSNAVGMPYHICYESDRLDAEIEELKAQGYKVVIEPRPAVAFDGRRVVFMMNIGFGLMEIVEN